MMNDMVFFDLFTLESQPIDTDDDDDDDDDVHHHNDKNVIEMWVGETRLKNSKLRLIERIQRIESEN
jgi:hypothetical protein